MNRINNNKDNNKKNILILTLTLGVGGAERQTEDLVNGMSLDLFNITMLYFHQSDKDNVNLNRNKQKHIYRIKRAGKFDFSSVSTISRYIVENKIDVVFCVEEFAFLFGYLARKICSRKFKLITAIHHTEPFEGKWSKIKDYFYHFILNSNDQLIFVSQNQMQYWIKENKINPDISSVIHNGINVDYYSMSETDKVYPNARKTIRSELEIPEDHFVIGINALIRKAKRHVDLIDAIKLCHQQGYIKLSACIIGWGTYESEVKDYVIQNNMQDYIKLVGFKKDVRPYIQLCDCMCLPSDTEAFSMSILESMALGKPVIMSNVGGANEQVIEGVNGYLFEPRDVEKLARHIIKCIDKQDNILAENCRKSVCERFSSATMLGKYEQLFLS